MTKNPYRWIELELEELESGHLRRELRRRESPHVAGMVQLNGVQFVDFGSNDYLGISSDSRLVDEVKMHVGYVGWGSAASPLISGRGVLHARLEEELASFEGTEAALLFPTGFSANVGTITSLIGKGDIVFSDAKNHASIIDGCRLSRANVEVYRHNDVDHLRSLLNEAAKYRRRLIVSDGLFSMDGDIAPVPQLVELAETFDAMLMIDEAHATGIFGNQGRGITEWMNCEAESVIRVGTLSKAIGSVGGFVSGSQDQIDWITNRARTYIFSTIMPEAMAAPTIAALRIVQSEPQRRIDLLAKADRLRTSLREIGWNTGASRSQIIPIVIGTSQQTMAIARQLEQEGLFVPGIRPPSVPEGESLLRISLRHGHTQDALNKLLEALERSRNLTE